LLRNWLAWSKTVVSISRDATVRRLGKAQEDLDGMDSSAWRIFVPKKNLGKIKENPNNCESLLNLLFLNRDKDLDREGEKEKV